MLLLESSAMPRGLSRTKITSSPLPVKLSMVAVGEAVYVAGEPGTHAPVPNSG
jgi:hypothetical protein